MNQEEYNELKQKQDETLILVKKMWRAEKWRRAYGFIKILLLAALAAGSYFALQPLLDTFLPLFEQIKQLQNLP